VGGPQWGKNVSSDNGEKGHCFTTKTERTLAVSQREGLNVRKWGSVGEKEGLSKKVAEVKAW